MGNISDVMSEYSEDMDAVQEFCDSIYNEHFASNFLKVRELYNRMKSEIHPITDDELEYILTTLPLELFIISEQLNKIRLNCEVVKLKNKQKTEEVRSEAINEANANGLNKTQTNEYVTHKVNKFLIEYDILHSAYSSVITRVENEQTFSKELIMGAKKVWDSRRSAETSNPVGLVISDLPEYNVSTMKNTKPTF